MLKILRIWHHCHHILLDHRTNVFRTTLAHKVQRQERKRWNKKKKRSGERTYLADTIFFTAFALQLYTHLLILNILHHVFFLLFQQYMIPIDIKINTKNVR